MEFLTEGASLTHLDFLNFTKRNFFDFRRHRSGKNLRSLSFPILSTGASCCHDNEHQPQLKVRPNPHYHHDNEHQPQYTARPNPSCCHDNQHQPQFKDGTNPHLNEHRPQFKARRNPTVALITNIDHSLKLDPIPTFITLTNIDKSLKLDPIPTVTTKTNIDHI